MIYLDTCYVTHCEIYTVSYYLDEKRLLQLLCKEGYWQCVCLNCLNNNIGQSSENMTKPDSLTTKLDFRIVTI